ncbi:inositol monophosphatase family protein [Anaeromyxobacter diazotrophicus]|uniref:Histidinol phosphate phosphatase n=1 Tax=Anaeromyxobacter diazotrophicus TaxID=2590199 RepID=A0A7I9VPL9_9BACT|nr:inositol monophosphatase family protein [Anaeromyxobacter diazotrophicus]GEJ58060.1 histidinol phosphate phosphatase [Anaeromyxobacter diazotrophicus]
MPTLDLDLALATARRAVEAAAAAALAHFRRGVRVDLKPDRSPVTIADRESEAAILAIVKAAFPDHAVLGEETGAHAGAAATRWIVDPLDGTRGFTRGEELWGPLVALEHEGEVVVGAMALPVAGEVYFAARGRGAWLAKGGGAPEPLRVSGVVRWEDASLQLGEPRVLLAPPFAGPVERLATSCARTRCYGDLAGFAMVLTGRAEAWIEAGVQLWDLGPMKVLVEEAGGRFTDLAGAATVASGHCVASNGLVHEHLLAALAPALAAR